MTKKEQTERLSPEYIEKFINLMDGTTTNLQIINFLGLKDKINAFMKLILDNEFLLEREIIKEFLLKENITPLEFMFFKTLSECSKLLSENYKLKSKLM